MNIQLKPLDPKTVHEFSVRAIIDEEGEPRLCEVRRHRVLVGSNFELKGFVIADGTGRQRVVQSLDNVYALPPKLGL